MNILNGGSLHGITFHHANPDINEDFFYQYLDDNLGPDKLDELIEYCGKNGLFSIVDYGIDAQPSTLKADYEIVTIFKDVETNYSLLQRADEFRLLDMNKLGPLINLVLSERDTVPIIVVTLRMTDVPKEIQPFLRVV